MNTDIELMAEIEVRLDTVIWLPGSGMAVSAETKALEEFREDMPEREDAPLYRQLPALAKFCGECPDDEDLSFAIGDIGGFLVQAATPVRTYLDDDMSQFSWGHYRTAWLYADSESQIAPVAKEWAEAEHAAMKAKSLASDQTKEK